MKKNKLYRKMGNFAIILLLVILFSAVVSAIPNSINIQGKLTDTSGTIKTGTFNFTFRIYDNFTSGNKLYETNVTATADARGIYDVILQDIDLTFNEQNYLAVKVNDDSEMEPRVNLTSVPYSFEANESRNLNTTQDVFINNEINLTAAGNIDASGTITGNTLAATTQLDIAGGFSAGGLTIDSSGDIITQGDILFSGNVTILNVSHLSINGSNFPALDDTFDLGNGSLRWRSGYIIDLVAAGSISVGGSINASAINTTRLSVNNTLFVNDSRVGIGTTTPSEKLTLAGPGNFLQTSGSPVKVGGTDAADSANSVYVSGKYAYVVTDSTGDDLEIFDISNPTNPVKVGGTDAADSANDVYVSGKYAYVVSESGGDDLEIFDISNSTTPVKVGGLNIGQTKGIYVSGKYAYLTTTITTDGFQIIDISDPTNPVKVGGADAPTFLNAVYVSGDFAYVVSSFSPRNLEIYDISNPTNPVLVGGSSLENIAQDVYVSGTHAYITSRADGDDLEIYNISNPTNPVLVGGVEAEDDAIGVYVSGKYAYVTSASGGDELEVFDISDPANPVKVGGTDAADSANSVYVSGKYAYVVTDSTGDDLEIYDISGIDTPAANIGDLAVGTLDVWENAVIQNNLYAQGGLNVGPGGILTDGLLSVSGSGDNYFAGNVGIGTTSPATALSIADNLNLSFGSGGDSRIYYDGTDTFWDLRGAGSGDLMIGLAAGFPSPDAGTIHIWDGTAGSVTASPDTQLVIESNVQAGIEILAPDNQAKAIYFGEPGSSTQGRIVYYGSTDSPSNTFGIFTANGERLRISANTFAFQEATTISALNGDLTLNNTGTGDVILQPLAGNVGIGTTTPTSPLDVLNNVTISGNLTIGNSNENSNITMYDPDGVAWNCGPNTAGSFICS